MEAVTLCDRGCNPVCPGAPEWASFQASAHDPLLDARAPLQLVLRELRLLAAEPCRAVGVWSGGASAASDGSREEAAGPAAASRSYRVAEVQPVTLCIQPVTLCIQPVTLCIPPQPAGATGWRRCSDPRQAGWVWKEA